jgi:hypothetical protein
MGRKGKNGKGYGRNSQNQRVPWAQLTSQEQQFNLQLRTAARVPQQAAKAERKEQRRKKVERDRKRMIGEEVPSSPDDDKESGSDEEGYARGPFINANDYVVVWHTRKLK